MRVLVSEPLSDAGLELLQREHEVDVRPELAVEGLAEAIEPYDALIVRSQTKVTDEVLGRASSLKVVGRAGIGLDNVDIEAATRRGIIVVNAPQSNIVSAAEHTIGLLLAQARNIPQAHAALTAGAWERTRFRGIELTPSLEALLVQADIVTIHLPRTAETEGLIGEREVQLMKEGARIVNTSRGGIIDERALVSALREGRLAGAAIDVFASEPVSPSHPLLHLDRVVVTPHLGAATQEAQDKAGTAIAEMVALALRGEFVPYAVNIAAAGEIHEEVRPFVPLAEKLGAVLTGIAEGPMRLLEAEYLGRLAEHDTRALTLAALKGALAPVVDEPVSFVNAPVIARDRGLHVSERKSTAARDYVNLVSLRAETEAGEVAVAGTLVGARGGERLVQVYGFDLDMAPARHLAFLLYEDRPGIIGTVGTLLGAAGINIASMEVGRRDQGGPALMALAVDLPIPPEVLGRIASEIGATRARALLLPV